MTAVSSTSLTVGSTTAALTSSTVVKNGNRTLSIADIQVGQRVGVKADRDSAGHLTATQVRINH